jgi:hypothetical protein
MKGFMKLIPSAVFFISLFGCAIIPSPYPSVAPMTNYSMERVALITPNEPNWYLMQSQLHAFVIAKKFDDASQSAVIAAMMYPVGSNKPSREFLEFIISERSKNDDKNRYKNITSKNEFVTFKGLPCVKYQTLAEDHKDKGIASADFEYFKTDGYICRYPITISAFQVEISHRSKDKEIPSDILKTGRDFFQSVQFDELIVKKLKGAR